MIVSSASRMCFPTLILDRTHTYLKSYEQKTKIKIFSFFGISQKLQQVDRISFQILKGLKYEQLCTHLNFFLFLTVYEISVNLIFFNGRSDNDAVRHILKIFLYIIQSVALNTPRTIAALP